MTHDEAERIVKALRRYYPTAKIYSDTSKLEDFRSVLLPLDFDDVVAVCKNHVRSCKFFPLPAEIITKLPRHDEPDNARRTTANLKWVVDASRAIDAEIDARGGVCALLDEYGGAVGETMREHYPDERFCGDKCRKVAVTGKCPYEKITNGGVKHGLLGN